MREMKSKEEAQILYNIDEVRFVDKKIYIRGWAFSTDLSEVNISSNQLQEVQLERRMRVDVEDTYKQYKLERCGFVLEGVPVQNHIQVQLVSESDVKEHVINLKQQKIEILFSSYVSIWRKLNKENIGKAIQYLKKYGIIEGSKKILSKVRKKKNSSITYDNWRQHNMATIEELEIQKNYKFKITPKISIVVPTYNTPINFLKEMIQSVKEQTYSNWELCIADGNSTGVEVKEVLTAYAQDDARIKINFLSENKGIAGNTNECLKLCTGEYIALFDHDDLLEPNALYEMVKKINEDQQIDFIYSDEDKVDEYSKSYYDPHFKQDWAPDTFRSYNYICHFTVFKRSLLEQVGEFDSRFDGSQDYDMFLRLTEKAEKIVHIPKILYHWRVHKESTASDISAKQYTIDAAKRALEEHLKRIGVDGKIEPGLVRGTHRTNYTIKESPKVSIIIPTKDHIDDLKKCLDAIKKSTYTNYEIILVENNSVEKETFEYYEMLKEDENIQVIIWDEAFNYSKINNFGIKHSKGEYIVLLNNDVELLTPNWIEEMLMHCQREEVGIVGAKLYYPDDTIQHAGVIIGIGGVAGHSHKYYGREENGYFSRLKIIQNLSAVTAACLMIRRDVFDRVGGLEEAFTVAFNDVDLCLKVRELNKLVIFTPYVEAYHYESKSRGAEDTLEKLERFNNEIELFKNRWGLYRTDPYYNSNLSLEKEDFSFKDE